MLAMTAVIVDYTFKMCFNFLYSIGGLPPTLPLDGPGCVNNALINALKN